MTSQEHQVQEIEETEPLNLTGLLPQKLTPQSQGVKIHQFKKQKQTRTVLQITGRQRKKNQTERRDLQKECEMKQKQVNYQTLSSKQWL